MGKLAGIKITNISWCVEEEDVLNHYDWWFRIDEVSDEEMNAAIDKIKAGLPTEEFIPTNKQNLANDLSLLPDWLSDKYGWLVNSFDYSLVDDGGKVLV